MNLPIRFHRSSWAAVWLVQQDTAQLARALSVRIRHLPGVAIASRRTRQNLSFEIRPSMPRKTRKVVWSGRLSADDFLGDLSLAYP